jgi:hypothetical protein
VRRLLDAAHGEVVELLTGYHESLESLNRALLANETLEEHDAYAAAGVPHSAAFPDGPPLASVWSSGEQPAATGVAARNGRSLLPRTLQPEQEQL